MPSPHYTLVSHNAAAHRSVLRMFQALARVARDGSVPRRVLDAGIDAGLVMLRAHHAYEEELLLPLLRRKGAAGPWDQVSADHEALEALLDDLERAGGGRADKLDAVVTLLEPHLALEEEHLTEAFWAGLLDPEEASAFGKEVAAHSRAHLKPGAKLLPLVVYNLDPDERAAFTARMPGFVVRGLVPYAFRAAWRPLRPFMAYPPPRLSPFP